MRVLGYNDVRFNPGIQSVAVKLVSPAFSEVLLFCSLCNVFCW